MRDENLSTEQKYNILTNTSEKVPITPIKSVKKLNVSENLDNVRSKTPIDNQRSKCFDLCVKGEWANVEQILRSYNKENPFPNFVDLVIDSN